MHEHSSTMEDIMAHPRMSQLTPILARGVRRALEVQRPQFSRPQDVEGEVQETTIGGDSGSP